MPVRLASPRGLPARHYRKRTGYAKTGVTWDAFADERCLIDALYLSLSLDPDRKICLCFGVSRRKIINFIRVEKPRRASQLAECYGAGTGCGWCRKYLKQLFETHSPQESDRLDSRPLETNLPDPEIYAELRAQYMERTGRRPPSE